MVEIVFESHSTSVDNERGIATGWRHGRLSERGREEAAALGARRRNDAIAAVFPSDLRRAMETAEIAFGGSGIPIHPDARLRECDYGELNGGPAAEVAAERSRRIDEPFPSGESYRDVVERVRSFVEEVSSAYDGRRIVVVGHSATRWALEHVVTGRPLEELVEEPFEWQPGWLYVVGPSTG